MQAATIQFSSECAICGESTTSNRQLCNRHRRELWLIKNANAIERYMAQGLSFKTAEQKVKQNNGHKRSCLCCGESVARNALFCSKTKRCRSARDRMKYLVHKKLVPKDLALKTVLEDL